MSLFLLILGVALWWGAHVLKRVAPGLRNELDIRMGDASKGLIAGLIVLSVILMVIGYRGADFIPIYTPPSWAVHLNNLLMLGAVVLFGMGSSKGRARSWLRHPMLTGLLVWAIAHLLVNGDLASLILFGGLGVWAPVSMMIVNRARPDWKRPEPGPLAGDIKLAVISVVVFIVIGTIHSLLGPWPFPG